MESERRAVEHLKSIIQGGTSLMSPGDSEQDQHNEEVKHS